MRQHLTQANMASKQIAPAGECFTSEVIFTKQQLQYFGCQDTKRLHNLQLEAMMVIQGLDSSQRT